MRGKAVADTYHPHYHGITPAYAGKRKICYTESTGKQDHPRLCGEKSASTSHVRKLWGSPPPMRGKERITRHKIKYLGITPAYAGKSFVAAVVICGVRDHPRLCGEKQVVYFL